MPVIYFRTDGNETIATGHLMRCLSIARACNKLGAEVCFLVADETSESLLQSRFLTPDEFPVQCLHSNYEVLETELLLLKQLLMKDKRSDSYRTDCFLFLDSYFVTETYLAALQKICPVAYLDDMLAFSYPVDFVINYDVTEGQSGLQPYDNIPHRLLGASYTPLREQFQNVSYPVKPQVENIFISTGGTDSYNVAGTLLERIFAVSNKASGISSAGVSHAEACLQQYQYYVVTSSLNFHYKQLKQLESLFPAIHILENIADMASLMKQCDLGISAGGTTLYELCAVSIPSISFSTADNQQTAVETFAAQNLIPYAGDVRASLEAVITHILTFLQEKSCEENSYEERKKSSQNMRAFIDGKGSVRIAQALLTFLKSL